MATCLSDAANNIRFTITAAPPAAAAAMPGDDDDDDFDTSDAHHNQNLYIGFWTKRFRF